ncbi:hypothetical protein LNL84_08520 [Vibrio sp. ZSDZ34]|uniref:Uncharacterized protein n=1 Tax=Vibrio gelatinilyticus TaxID=2893468 RepID=A0A9X1WAZ2_9VIBR|nr:hypothetical protein [Vibrio gelatinilyticus]MCJ2376879.1 hypothetical protein [Vibrio gelatinilyticus]
MSDPLAVYNRVGAGVTNNGLNLKFGLEYETPDNDKQSMHVIEVKGIAGESLGWSDHDKHDNSIDTFRYRNFLLDKQENRGTQIGIDWNFDTDMGSASYSFLQGTPKVGAFQFYPLAGAGVTVSDDKEDGINVPGGFALIGVYAKATLSDNVWINYNPMYKIGIGGQMSGWDQIDHEVSVSYKIDERQNICFYANWSDETSFEDGDFRVEFNYQF